MANASIRSGLLILALLAARSAAAQTTINFDDLPARTELRNQYGAKGVHFRGSIIATNDNPHSAKNVLYCVDPFEENFSWPGPLTIDFDNGQRAVSVFAGTFGSEAESATLTAFNASGQQIAKIGPLKVTPGPFVTRMEVKFATASIRRVELLYANDHNELLDDVTFTGGATSPPPPAPTVTISSPTPNQPTGATTFIVEGKVVGKQVDPHANIRVHIPRPPGSSTTTDFNHPITLIPGGAPNTFTFSQQVNLGIGSQTITVDAENGVGLHGKGTVIIDALPDQIRARLRQEGGTAALGPFSFGSVTAVGACLYAVYPNGAISLIGGTTSVARGAILQKWRTLVDQSKFPTLGCSKTEQRTAVGTVRAQDFVDGRIYESAQGTFFVPPVFTNAIDTLGGEAGVGVPTADPTSDSREAFKTWLFQRFVRSGIPIPSTLEIRGDPPKLVVQRQAGDGSLYTNVLRPSNPTFVDSFDCSTTAGPCKVTAPPDEPLFTGTSALCHDKEFNWKQQIKGFVTDPDPPEWVPIKGNNVTVPIWGVLFDIHLAHGDNPFTHRNRFDPCPLPTLEAIVNELICPSDWDLKIRPVPGFRSMQPEGRDAVQIEFERVDFQHQLVGYGDPNLGDLTFAAGRFVVDCGHGPKFKTEIHPPSVYAAVKMVTRSARPATQMDLWVNRFFIGGDAPSDAVEFDVWPPPRPTPQALLGVTKPADQTAAITVTYREQAPYGPVRVHITGKPKKVPEVTNLGEMKPRTDDAAFGFDGRLDVYWNCPGGCPASVVARPTAAASPRKTTTKGASQEKQ